MTLTNHTLKALEELEQRVADYTELEQAYLKLIELILEGELQAKIDRLEAVNQELVEALKLALPLSSNSIYVKPEQSLRSVILQAIAKAKGE